jgi:hypothetical protein
VDGEAKGDPERVLAEYPPRCCAELFDTRYYLSRVFENPAIRFFVGYVVQPAPRASRLRVHARIFYKDISLVWRVASHFISTDDDFWIGKGAVREQHVDGHVLEHSAESTTDLPLEVQTAFETLARRAKRVTDDAESLYLILRRAPAGRIAPYHDFAGPRDRAASNPKNLVHGDRPIARFTRQNDPTSLRIVRGYEPDFSRDALVERSTSRSRLYGGRLDRFRILSTNRRIQYLFMAGARHVWIIPPQALTTELSSFGVRTIDVHADEDLFVPGYEYHYFGEHGDSFSQIPDGWAGAPSPQDPERADASAWLDALPVVERFRRWRSRASAARPRRTRASDRGP